jgi:acyl-coenzyme A synthetase/AMP-(fatty) acid ligase
MQRIDNLIETFVERGSAEALIWDNRSLAFRELEEYRRRWLGRLATNGVRPGQVVGLRADYSPDSVSLFLALLSNRNIVALISPHALSEKLLLDDCQAEVLFRAKKSGGWNVEPRSCKADHPLLRRLKAANTAGFVVFTSGSTGRPKAVLHDLDKFLAKFITASKRLRTLTFLLFDHIAGIDTLFYCLWSGAPQVLPGSREVKHICELLQRHRVEVLPTSPTFLNLLCWSGEYEHHDLSSLKIITYGTERMNPSVLAKLNTVLPQCRFIQKYGASEFGSPRSKSRGNDELWINIKESECEIKVVDNVLWVRSPSAMMGYLNAPNPFDDGDWFCTGDEVAVNGEWMQILGRKSDLITVGGEKVYPAEVEDAVLEIEDVIDVVVRGEPSALTGQIVSALVQVKDTSEERAISRKIRRHCRGKLEPYKVPVRIELTDKPLLSARAKKCRLAAPPFGVAAPAYQGVKAEELAVSQFAILDHGQVSRITSSQESVKKDEN